MKFSTLEIWTCQHSAPGFRGWRRHPIAIQLLKLHDSQVHDLASKPVLTMTDDAVEDTDWEQFKLEQNKNLG